MKRIGKNACFLQGDGIVKDLFVLRSGESQVEVGQNGNSFQLLVDHDNVNIVINHIKAASTVWITPGENHNYLEFYRMLSGEATLRRGDKEQPLKAGDSFYFVDYEEDLSLIPHTDIDLLCVTSQPVFGDFMAFINDLNDLNVQIEEKDHYTFGHCKRVMRYAQELSHEMKLDDERTHNLLLAALYHDVGKCYLPLEILNKPGRVTDSEYEQIKRHPAHSAEFLTGRFVPEVARIARAHHERLDGSGYPDGISGDAIPTEARILALADTFDAMTTDRPYKKGKTTQEAIDELSGLTRFYDVQVLEAFKRLADAGTVDEIQRLSREGKLEGRILTAQKPEA